MKQLRQNLKILLTQLNIPIHTSRVRPIDLKSLPCIVIYNQKKTLNNDIPNNLYLGGAESISIGVDVVISMIGEYADVLDDTISAIYDLLSNDVFLNANFNNLESLSVDYQYVSDGLEKPIAIGSITLNANRLK